MPMKQMAKEQASHAGGCACDQHVANKQGDCL